MTRHLLPATVLVLFFASPLPGPARAAAAPAAATADSARGPAVNLVAPLARPDWAAPAAPRGHGHPVRAAVILAVGGLAAAWAADEEDPEAARRVLDRSPFESAADVGNAYGSGWVAGGASLGVWAVGRATGSEAVGALGGDLCESFLLASTVCGVVKVAVDRRRPTGGGHSFPSGHTTVAFAMVPVLGHHLGWPAAVPAALVAAATGLGRMEDKHHFLSDVVFGAAVGLACGDLVSGEGFLPGHARLAATPQGLGVTVPF